MNPLADDQHVTAAQLLLGIVVLGAVLVLIGGLLVNRIATPPAPSPVVQMRTPPPTSPSPPPTPTVGPTHDPVATSDCGPECYDEPLDESGESD